MNKRKRAALQHRAKLFGEIDVIGQKKWKQLRRDMKFYETYFGFRDTFKVLCDGTFVHHCLTQRLGDLEGSLSAFLEAPAKPLVTNCVIAELKNISEAADVYSKSAIAAQHLELIKCEHEPSLLAAECLATFVGSHNEERYFVATQDMELRKRLRQVVGGALIYGNYAPMNLEYPSITQIQYAKMVDMERKSLTKRHKGKSKKEGGRKSHNDPLGVANPPIFKSKHAKGQEEKKKTKPKRHQQKKKP